ncbi:hypothetical protein [Flavobacterium sp.]|uniref:hypothetical protein n=1 Tax=Flavobacterium sp. TaxID=239 RepID=UPI002616BBF7|nr:hypothetical protein [Flavobacterium sp.]
MKNATKIIAVVAMFFAISCSETEVQPQGNQNDDMSRHGIPNQEAYYDGKLLTINLFELSDQATATILEHNVTFNKIYASIDLDEPQTFHPVIDAVPGKEFSPLWLQFIIEFNPRYTSHQFFSSAEVEDAEKSGEITLVKTGEVYRCSVIGN